MNPTELVYSSHDRCEYLHRQWIVQRALESWNNKTILYLPMSSGSRGDQEYSWGTFSWYLDQFRQWGLEPRTFFWSDDLDRGDAQVFFDWLRHSEVVILGGGRTSTGLERYQAMGARHFGNPEAFVQTLRARQLEGKLTVGFSAGADQLCERSGDSGAAMFGLVWRVMVRLHYEPGASDHIAYLARENADCLVFGLPNDSGIAAAHGRTPGGRAWQHLWLITDNSWDRPEDQFHIKTRWGVKIEHRYPDGRQWGFNGGDTILRVFHGDGGVETFIKRPEVESYLDYHTQDPTGYRSVDEILASR